MDALITTSKEILRFVLRTGSQWAANKLSDHEYLQKHAKLVTDAIEPQLDKIRKQIREQHAVELETATTLYEQALEVLKVTDLRKLRIRGSETTNPESEVSLPQRCVSLLEQSFDHSIKAFHAKKNLTVSERILAMQVALACIAILHDHEPECIVSRWSHLIDKKFFADVEIVQSLRVNLEYSGARRYFAGRNKDDLKCLVVMAADIYSQLREMRKECCPKQIASIDTIIENLVKPLTKMSEKGYSTWMNKLTTRSKAVETMTPECGHEDGMVAPTGDGSLILLIEKNPGKEIWLCKVDETLNEVYSRKIDTPRSGITVKGSVVYALMADDAIHGFDYENHFDEVDGTIPLQSIMTHEALVDFANKQTSFQFTPVATEHGHILLPVWSTKPYCLLVYIGSVKEPCSKQLSLIERKTRFVTSFSAYSTSETGIRIGFCTTDSKTGTKMKAFLMMTRRTDNGWVVESTLTFQDYDLCTFDEKGRFLMMNHARNELAFLELDGSEDERRLYKRKLHMSDNIQMPTCFTARRYTIWLVDGERIERIHLI